MNFDGMNYEDAAIMLTTVRMMHEANLKIMSPEEAEAERLSNLEKLVRTWRALNPEIASCDSMEAQSALRLCLGCNDEQPLVFFRRDDGGGYDEECMDCVAERLYRENHTRNAEWKNGKGYRKVTREMFVKAAQWYEAGFTVGELTRQLAYGRNYLPEDIELSVRSHTKRLLDSGELVIVGKRNLRGRGRPWALYRLASLDLGVPVEDLVKEE